MAAEDKYPEILADLREGLTEILIEAGVAPATAAGFAMAATERIRERWKGISIYIPEGRDWILSQRDYEIAKRFRGSNLHELCREYGLSAQRIYQIVARVRAEQIKKRQLSLFG